MSSFTTVEGTHTTEDGKELYTKTWKPTGEVKAYVVFVHGFSDHCNRYGPFFPTLASQGIEVRAWDQRGWGRSVKSPSDKGWTGPTSRVMDDMTSFLKTVIPSRPVQSAPVFLVGHSMGGGQTLTYIARGPKEITSQIRGYLVDAPFVGIHPKSRPLWITLTVGRLAGKVLPRFQMVNQVKPELCTRDPEAQRDLEADELCHDTGTLEGISGMLDRAGDLESGKTVIPKDAGEGGKTRLWVSHGTSDMVCDFNSTKKMYELLDDGIEDKEFKVYEGWYHQLHLDLPGEDRIKYANDVAGWILARVGSAM